MNEIDIYDFDKTVYNGDSSIDFWKFCLKKRFFLVFLLPWQALGFLLMKFGVLSGAKGKSMFFAFLKFVDGEKCVKEFWKVNESKINEWFSPKKRERKAIVCSASPEFLLHDICKKYDAEVVATVCDVNNGKISGANCKGDEKVRRLKSIIDISKVNTVYSDAPESDAPIFALGIKRIQVINGQRKEF